MKIVHIVGSGRVGGIETHVLTLTTAQRNLGHDVSVIIGQDRGAISDLMAEKGLDVHYANGTSGHDIKSRLITRGLLKKIKPDVVHIHGASLFSWIALAKIPAVSICTVHVIGTSRNAWRVRKILSFINRRIVHFMDGFIAVSSDVRDQFLAYGLFCDCEWRVIFNGIDQLKFYPADDTLLPTKENNQPIELLMVCRMEQDKHPDDAIRVAAILRNEYKMNVKLTICGDGRFLPACKKLAEEIGISEFVTFAGRRNDVNEFMRKSHGMFIMSDYEACPQVPIEGISSGCPVFSYHVPGGLHEWFKGEACGGVISKERTPASLAKEILPILSDRELWQKIRNNALACSSSFSDTKMAQNTLNFYQEFRVR